MGLAPSSTVSDGDRDGLRELFTYLFKSNVDPVRTRFRSHGVLRQQNSGGRQVARWLGSSGAPSEDHLLERHEDRAVRLTIEESSTVKSAVGGAVQVR